MTDGLLENIIQLEKQIQADVAREQKRAEQWQARELAELEELLAIAHAEEEDRCRQALSDQGTALQRKVDQIKAETKDWCKRLAALDDESLNGVLKRKLAEILPGGEHDHPHGQG